MVENLLSADPVSAYCISRPQGCQIARERCYNPRADCFSHRRRELGAARPRPNGGRRRGTPFPAPPVRRPPLRRAVRAPRLISFHGPDPSAGPVAPPLRKEPAVASRPDTTPIPGPRPAVIRRLDVAAEPPAARVLNRHLPAWVVSGAVHVAVIGFFVLVLSGPTEVEAKPTDLVNVQAEDPADDDPVL